MQLATNSALMPACRAGLAGRRRARRRSVGQGGRLSDRQTRQLVLRRGRPGRVVQPSRQDTSALYAWRNRQRRCRFPTAAASKIDYRFENQSLFARRFPGAPARHRFPVIRDGEVLAERYQYDRNADNRFVSHSMAKSIVSLAVGMALAEKKIASLDDTVAKYVPELAGNPYGETTIRNMLRMSSGVPFKEVYDGKDDLAKFNRIRFTQDSIAALREFKTREVEQGTRFHYASNQTVALTLLLRAVTGTTLSEYLTPRLWQPMGAEADATWIRTRDGTETGSGNFNASCATTDGLEFCWPMTARSAASRSCQRTICSMRPTGTASPRRSRREGDAVFRLRLSVLALSRREATVCVARRLRSVDLRRSRAQARDGDHRPRQECQCGEGALCAASAARSGAGSSANTVAGSGAMVRYCATRFLVPSRGMHLRVRNTPDRRHLRARDFLDLARRA